VYIYIYIYTHTHTQSVIRTYTCGVHVLACTQRTQRKNADTVSTLAFCPLRRLRQLRPSRLLCIFASISLVVQLAYFLCISCMRSLSICLRQLRHKCAHGSCVVLGFTYYTCDVQVLACTCVVSCAYSLYLRARAAERGQSVTSARR